MINCTWSSVRMMTMFGLGLEAADTQKMRRVSRWTRQVLPGVEGEEVVME